MSNEIVKMEFSPERIELIKSQIAPKATDDELKLFIYQAQRTGLDPLARQIYAIHRKVKDHTGNYVDKMTIQTSIDGFRVIAERSGDYAGQDEPFFGRDEPFFGRDDKDDPFCRVTVYRFRGDVRYPAAVGVAFWKEYVQTDREGKPSGMWAKMPRTMLAKVAEALALRKAYPQDLSGLYTNDEMKQADKKEVSVVADEDKNVLIQLLNTSTLKGSEYEGMKGAIQLCNDYALYQKLQYELEDKQVPYDQIPNPSTTDAKRAVKRAAGELPKTAA